MPAAAPIAASAQLKPLPAGATIGSGCAKGGWFFGSPWIACAAAGVFEVAWVDLLPTSRVNGGTRRHW